MSPTLVQPRSGSLTVCTACWYSTTRWPWWACHADSPCTNGATTERRACLSWRNSTSSGLLPSHRATHPRSPPDPHGDQPVQPPLVRADHLVDDVRPVGRGSPVPERGARGAPAQSSAQLVPLRAGRTAV